MHPLLKPARFLGLLFLFSMQSYAVIASDAVISVSTQQQQRLGIWQSIITTHQHDSAAQKIEIVNRFLNQFTYKKDQAEKNSSIEYWATPYEFLVNSGGDCEDFAIAKYFMLRALGIPEEDLQVTYVYHKDLQQSHMVLLYRPIHGRQALVLDNLSNTVQTLATRAELAPIYGFNQTDYWVVSAAAVRKKAGAASRLTRWQDLLERMRMHPQTPLTPALG